MCVYVSVRMDVILIHRVLTRTRHFATVFFLLFRTGNKRNKNAIHPVTQVVTRFLLTHTHTLDYSFRQKKTENVPPTQRNSLREAFLYSDEMK